MANSIHQLTIFFQTLFAPTQGIAIAPAQRNALAAFVLVAVTACSSGDSSEKHIANAKQYLNQAEYTAAIIELKNALQTKGDSAQARWLLGTAYLSTGDAPSAEKELLQAQKLGWDTNSVLPSLAQALYMQGENAAVGELPHDGLTPDAAAQLLSTKALAKLAQAEIEKARALIALALELQPDSVEVKIAEARLLAGLDDPIGALIVLEEVLEQEAGRGDAWSLKGDILLNQQNLPEALAAFDKSITLSPPGHTDRLKRGLINLQNQDYAAAQSEVDVVLQAAPGHLFGNYLLGLLRLRDGDYEEAISALSGAEQAWRQLPLVLFYLGNAHLLDGNLEQAQLFAHRFFNIMPESIRGRKLLATIYIQEGKFGDVQGLIQPVLALHPNDLGALNLAANALMSTGETDQGLDYLARIAELQSDSASAQVTLGAGLLMTGEADDAAQQFSAALDLNPEFSRAQILLILSHLQNNDYDQAIKAAEEYRTQNPGEVSPLILLGRVYLASGQRQLAITAFEEALRLDQGNPDANHNLAQLALAADDPQLARARYNTILEHHPDHLPSLLQLALLDAREQDEDSMVKRIKQANLAHPTDIESISLLGSYYLAIGKPERVQQLFSPLDDLQKESPQILALRAMAYLSMQQATEAQYTLEKLVELYPDTAHYHHLLAIAAAGSGDRKRVKPELKNVLELNPNHLPSLIALARLARLQGDSAEFEQYLGQLMKLAPEVPGVLRLRALTAQDKGDNTSAVKLGSRAFSAMPATVTMQELAAYHKTAGDTGQALRLQQDWIKSHPQDIKARLSLAEHLRQENMSEEMISQYRAVLELEPDNVTALNNLGWEIRAEDPEQALAYISHAADLAPDQAEVLDTLAVIEHLNGENRRASRNIQRALTKAPGNPSMLYHQAMIEAALGEKAAAISLLEELLGRRVDFPERADAEALLTSLKG